MGDDGRGQDALIGSHLGPVTLAGRMLAEHLAGSALGDM